MKGTSNLSMLPIVQQAYQNDPQSLLAQELLRSGGGGNNNTIGGGIASAIKSLSGAYFGRQAKDRYQAASSDVGNELGRIAKDPSNTTPDALIQAMSSSPNQFVKDMSTTAYGQMMANMLTPRDPLKVAPGETLYDPRTKQPIFSAAPKPEAVGEGGTLVDPSTGKTIFSAPQKPMAVAPGGTVVNPGTGQQIYKDNIFGGNPGNKSTENSQDQPSANLSGEDFLKTLPPTAANQIKMYAEGRETIPARAGNRQQILDAVVQYDPSFDAINYNARAAMRKDVTSGDLGKKVNNINAGIAHLSELQNAFEALKNSNSHIPGVTLYNSIGNAVNKSEGRNPVTDFNAVVNRVVPEIAGAYVSGGGTGTERGSDKADFNSDMTPDQYNGVLRETAKLLHSKINAIQDQVNKGMGTAANTGTLIRPDALKALQQLGVVGSDQVSKSSIPLSAAHPAIQEQVARNNLSKSFGGKNYININGKWFEQ